MLWLIWGVACVASAGKKAYLTFVRSLAFARQPFHNPDEGIKFV